MCKHKIRGSGSRVGSVHEGTPSHAYPLPLPPLLTETCVVRCDSASRHCGSSMVHGMYRSDSSFGAFLQLEVPEAPGVAHYGF